MERNLKRAVTTVVKNMSAEVQKSNELQEKILTELRKAWESQEEATKIDVLKYASPDVRQEYANSMANQLLCKKKADEKRAKLEFIQAAAELAKAKTP